MELQQVHLGWTCVEPATEGKPAKWKLRAGHSGRGVRFRVLPQGEIDAIQADIARSFGKDALFLQVESGSVAACVERMLVEYTDARVTPEQIGTATWTRADAGALAIHDVFTSKDRAMLRSVYKDFHHVSNAEVAEIMEGLVGVVVDATGTGGRS